MCAENDEKTVEDAMCAGPSTIRSNVALADVLERLEQQKTENVVTTSEGRLVGVVRACALAVT
jgi:predicted transcriptional regulator